MSVVTKTSGWILAGRAADVPELEGRSVTVAGRRIAVFHLPGGWAAVDGDCPHRGGPLSDGIVADCSVTCPLHNRRFDLIDGGRIGGEGGVVVHEIREHAGELHVRLADAP